MFVCSSTYSRPLGHGDGQVIEDHHAYIKQQYAEGRLLCSGPKVPRTGGIIVALGTDESEVRILLEGDPLSRAGIATYQIEQFAPSKACYTELVEPAE